MIVLRLLAALAVLQAVLFGFAEAVPTERAGTVMWVFDGDTFQISHPDMPQGEPVRARHFDTPEKGRQASCAAEQEKAQQATEAARRLLPRGTVVRLSDFGRDRYGRLLANVTLPDGRDLASVMIGAGLAVPYEGGKRTSWCRPFRRRRHDGRKAKGLSARSRGQEKSIRCETLAAPAPASRRGRRRFGRSISLVLATPDFTTGKRCGAQDLTALPGTQSEDLS